MAGKTYVAFGWTSAHAAIETAVFSSSRWSVRRFTDMLLDWHERARQRRALIALDDRMLKDIGISRAAAECEASKPFWRA